MSLHPAARVTDVFGHDVGLAGILASVALGVITGVGGSAISGLGAIGIGAGLATGGLAGLVGAAAIARSMAGSVTGWLQTGSTNVFINGLPATMVDLATGPCAREGGGPHRVASGAATVFINGHPAARITDSMDCGALIRTGSSNVFIGGPTASPVCTPLFADRAALERFRIDAQAAVASYDPPETRKPPEGYRNASPGDLQKLGLNEGMLEHPVDPKTGKATEFRAAVFIDKKTGAPLVAFKGTSPTSREDWAENFKQGRGKESFYYNRAQKIATRVATSPAGAGAHFTGHSLGGGMASAAARATGLPATTFNAAGLHANTVPHPVHAEIDAVYVKGEVLRRTQSIPFTPPSAATRTWPLEPSRKISGDMAARATAALGYINVGIFHAIRSGLLHMMGNVVPALGQKRADVEKALEKNHCL